MRKGWTFSPLFATMTPSIVSYTESFIVEVFLIMDPDSIRTIFFMVVLVIFSGYLSATETAFSSINRIRVKNMADAGNRRAARVLRLSENYDRLLSTILVGNNIVNILLTSIATLFFVDLYGESLGATVSTIVSTVVVLIFGEISPKSLAKDHAEGFAMFSAPILTLIVYLLYPINLFFTLWKKLMNLLFKPKAEASVTEEELLTIVDEAEQGGSLNEQESDLIRRVIAFNDRGALDILIPRVDVTGIPVDATPEELAAVFADTGYSRLPVYEETMDHIVGVVHLKDCLERNAGPATVMQPAFFVPPTIKIRLLLRQMQEEKAHIAIVSDEYGGTLGIVTMEDILEELVGDIWDEHDDVIENIRDGEDGSSVVLCSTVLEDMMNHFGTRTACDAATVSGWVMEALGSIPAVGDAFTADGLSVVVTQIEQNRPLEICVTPVTDEERED